MSPRVLKATPLKNYHVDLTFTDGGHRILDMSPYLSFGIFHKLKTETLFQQVRVSYGTLDWPCGLDLDPDFVWGKSIPV